MLATTSPTNADNIVGSVKTPCRSLKYCDFREKHEKWGWLSPFPINHWKVWKQCSAWWNYRLESTSHSPHIPEFNDTFFPLPTFSSIIAFACCQSHNVFSYKKNNNFNIAKAGNVTLPDFDTWKYKHGVKCNTFRALTLFKMNSGDVNRTGASPQQATTRRVRFLHSKFCIVTLNLLLACFAIPDHTDLEPSRAARIAQITAGQPFW